MSKEINQIYEFGDFRLETAERLLLRAGQPVSLTPKSFEMLLVLVRSGGHVVQKDELMKQVWPEAFVEEANLARHVWALRKALGDDDDVHRYIATVPKLGYRFVASVTAVPEPRDLPSVAEVSDHRDLLIQRRIRARIVSEDADQNEALEVGANSRGSGKLIPGTTALTIARARIRRRRNAALVMAGLLAAIIVGGLLVRKARSKPSPKTIESLSCRLLI